MEGLERVAECNRCSKMLQQNRAGELGSVRASEPQLAFTTRKRVLPTRREGRFSVPQTLLFVPIESSLVPDLPFLSRPLVARLDAASKSVRLEHQLPPLASADPEKIASSLFESQWPGLRDAELWGVTPLLFPDASSVPRSESNLIANAVPILRTRNAGSHGTTVPWLRHMNRSLARPRLPRHVDRSLRDRVRVSERRELVGVTFRASCRPGPSSSWRVPPFSWQAP